MYQKRAAVAARRPKNFRAPASENRTQYDHACTPNVEEVLPYTEKDSLVRPFGYAAVVPWVGGLTTITRGPSRRMRARRGKLRALVSVRVLASDEEVLPNGHVEVILPNATLAKAAIGDYSRPTVSGLRDGRAAFSFALSSSCVLAGPRGARSGVSARRAARGPPPPRVFP